MACIVTGAPRITQTVSNVELVLTTKSSRFQDVDGAFLNSFDGLLNILMLVTVESRIVAITATRIKMMIMTTPMEIRNVLLVEKVDEDDNVDTGHCCNPRAGDWPAGFVKNRRACILHVPVLAKSLLI